MSWLTFKHAGAAGVAHYKFTRGGDRAPFTTGHKGRGPCPFWTGHVLVSQICPFTHTDSDARGRGVSPFAERLLVFGRRKKQKTIESTIQLTIQSITHSTSQKPFNPQLSQPLSQQLGQFLIQPHSPPFSQPLNQPCSQPISQPFSQLLRPRVS